MTWRVVECEEDRWQSSLLPLFPSGRWFDVLQKVSSQLKTNLTGATKNRTDKVSGWPWADCGPVMWTQALETPGSLPGAFGGCVLTGSSSFEQNAIHNHIRLFEPLVIKALKQYTTTTSVQLQKQVLDLLAQLVQLRVNYCLLDSDQVCHVPLSSLLKNSEDYFFLSGCCLSPLVKKWQVQEAWMPHVCVVLSLG